MRLKSRPVFAIYANHLNYVWFRLEPRRCSKRPIIDPCTTQELSHAWPTFA
jgi:hypothetical protein